LSSGEDEEGNRALLPADSLLPVTLISLSPLARFFAIIRDMHLQLITLRGKKLDQEVYQVTIPTENGPIAVYPSHESYVTMAVPGALAIRKHQNDSDDQLEYLAITGGVVKVASDVVRILVDEADRSEDILEDESKAALARAEEMRANAKDQVELEKAMELIDRHAVRLKVAELRRKRRV